jgi:membrane protein
MARHSMNSTPFTLSALHAGKALFQRVWISVQYFGSNGLANHAAAGAYGFLLSLMPALLIVAFLISEIYASPPREVAGLILQMGFLGDTFDISGTVERFLNTFHPGFAGLSSLVSILLAAIVFAFSMQRGLNSIFPNTKAANPVKKWLVPLGLELAVILFVFIAVVSARPSLMLFGTDANRGILNIMYLLFPFAGLGLLSLGAYSLVPDRHPGWRSSLSGMVLCISVYAVISAFFNVFINPARYDIMYGTLSNLILLLAKVYFFFVLFFIGAQFAFVCEYFDALLFIKLRMIRSAPGVFFIDKFLFSSAANGRLQKYVRMYKQGETIFLQGEDSHDIYYILSGSASIYINKKDGGQNRIALIGADNFFGEMGHVLANRRSATAKADSVLTALVLPPSLFVQILTIDRNADNKVIETLSERLKKTNERLG